MSVHFRVNEALNICCQDREEKISFNILVSALSIKLGSIQKHRFVLGFVTISEMASLGIAYMLSYLQLPVPVLRDHSFEDTRLL